MADEAYSATGRGYSLSPSQGLRIMALAVMLREREVEFRGECAVEAIATVLDIGEEIALQSGALSDG